MSASNPPSTNRSISFGMLIIPLQALDMVGPMDVLSNISYDMINAILPITPPGFYPFSTDGLLDSSPVINFHHIGPTMDPVKTTGNCFIQPTTTIADCPKLDYLLIGGPGPEYFTNVPENMKTFMLERSKEVKAIFTTCTGGLVLAATGILDGLPATTNHVCIPIGAQVCPNVKWDNERHWVVVRPDDEVVKGSGSRIGCEIWTAAGASAGMNMIAHWITTEFGPEVGPKLLGMTTSLLEWRPNDVEGRPMQYVSGKGKMVAA